MYKIITCQLDGKSDAKYFIKKWLVKPHDDVSRKDDLLVIASENDEIVVQSPVQGRLLMIAKAENMKVNDVRCLVIPPKLAYGNRKMGNILEANSTLIFEIQLLDIINLDTEEKEQ